MTSHGELNDSQSKQRCSFLSLIL